MNNKFDVLSRDLGLSVTNWAAPKKFDVSFGSFALRP